MEKLTCLGTWYTVDRDDVIYKDCYTTYSSETVQQEGDATGTIVIGEFDKFNIG